MRIEHTRDDQNRPSRGFEARGGHQTTSASASATIVPYQPSFGKVKKMRHWFHMEQRLIIRRKILSYLVMCGYMPRERLISSYAPCTC